MVPLCISFYISAAISGAMRSREIRPIGKVRVQEHNGQFTVTLLRSAINQVGWKRGDELNEFCFRPGERTEMERTAILLEVVLEE